jgi:hypothetical protein
MADADLDAVIRQLAKQQNKTILATAKKRRDRFNGMAVKAKDKDAKERFKMLAREAFEQASAAARRLLLSADNAADSYARAMRQAAAAELPKKVEKKIQKPTDVAADASKAAIETSKAKPVKTKPVKAKAKKPAKKSKA